MLSAREALFFRGCDELTIIKDRGGRVMKEARDS